VIQEAFGVNEHIEDVTPAVRRRGIPHRRARAVPPGGRRSLDDYDNLDFNQLLALF